MILSRLGAPATYLLWLSVPIWLLMALSAVLWPSARAAVLPRSAVDLLLDPFRVLQATPETSANAAAPAYLDLLGFCWLVGAGVFLAVLIYRCTSAARMLRLARKVSDAHRSRIGCDASLRIRTSDELSGPAVVGLFRPWILLPDSFEQRFEQDMLDLILRHEACHLRRRDNAANLFAEIMLALMWLNPLAWLAYRAFRVDQELSCDAHALAECGTDRRIGYARSLLGLSAPNFDSLGNKATACSWYSSASLKRRINMLDKHRPRHFRPLPRLTLLTAVVAGAAFLLPSSPAATEQHAVDPEVVVEPIAIVRFAPRYPREAAEQGIEGHVTAEFTITENGTVEDIILVDSMPGEVFVEPAIDALARWRFRPDVVDGVALPSRARQTIEFKLDKNEEAD